MKPLTIQFRLTAWYFLSLAVIVGLLGAGSWLAMRASMYEAVDKDLRYRLRDVTSFIQSHSLNSTDRFDRSFANSVDAAVVGILVQITDDDADVLYESGVLRGHRAPVMARGPSNGSVSLDTVRGGRHIWPMRVASRRIQVGGVGLTIHIVEPLHDLLDALDGYTFTLVLFVPMALLLTAVAGYWISRRALYPVEQIRRDADAIDPADLTARLPVPSTGDELARLAQTLNAMLARIEAGFLSVQQFTADASHELRAPLSLIITAADISLRRERTREEMTEALRKIQRDARHMSKLIESLLALARGDAQPGAPSVEPVDLAGILRELGTQLQPLVEQKGLTLTLVAAEQEIRVIGDDNELRRLFLILLDNAIKYTETGSITVTLDDSGRVTVQDTGIGIAAAGLPHVFDRFWRADKVRSRAEGGAGLGLALARQIVQRHGGTIAVDSQVGRGTIFTVQLRRTNDA